MDCISRLPILSQALLSAGWCKRPTRNAPGGVEESRGGRQVRGFWRRRGALRLAPAPGSPPGRRIVSAADGRAARVVAAARLCARSCPWTCRFLPVLARGPVARLLLPPPDPAFAACLALVAGVMIRQEPSSSYQELSDDVEHVAVNAGPSEEKEDDPEDSGSTILPVLDNGASVHFSKSCLKNVFSVILLFIYLLLMAVAIFLVYQTITDFREKLKHPVMSVSYKEVSTYDAPGIALYPGKAELLTCKHHYYDYIPPLENPGQPGEIECTTQRISYTDPFTNQTKFSDPHIDTEGRDPHFLAVLPAYLLFFLHS
ncbi:hypothetical protein JRQ81_004832 [Phrynocephalus forsythii]|uniref:Proton-activated chloride channel n=1 Tax=Phrynocephalus forsythii TaxID=171643 RepID=A0A9Q0Y2B1_9SAUR|nr:hypothetical protein JRQ81_004832 [Phrynocephalus forsythii]